MKKTFLSCIISLALVQLSNAQSAKNYIIEIDGDTLHVSLDEMINFKSKSGQTHKVKVSRKEFLTFSNEFISFNYPSQYSVSSTRIDEDVEQILLMTATGNGLMIQAYGTVNPELIIDLMLNEVTQDDISAGYKQTLTETQKTIGDGTVLKGKRAVLTLDKETEEFVCVANGKKKKGIMVMEIKNDADDTDAAKMFDVFWKTLKIKY
ncbi:MAG: hypothetical protein WDO16_22000 [Bacteroidota bacterium]